MSVFYFKTRVICLMLIISIIFSFIPFISYGSELTDEETKTGISRYTVLVIDVSGSMRGTPMTTLKSAANKFCDDILKADGDNYVAIVEYATSASILSNFTDDNEKLKSIINSLNANGGTNINLGLQFADNLLRKIPKDNNVVKNILLFSDGLPGTGSISNDGPYNFLDYNGYRYANATYNTAESLKDNGYSLYTLGFFHGLTGNTLNFARRFMDDLQNEGYYDVTNVEELEFVFGEIMDKITKITGIFKCNGVLDGKDSEATFYYSDEYFFDRSYDRNNSLATMSLCLAMSSFASNDTSIPYSNKSINARNLLEQIGFSNFRTNDYYEEKPQTDSIGVVAANKKIEVDGKEYTLLAVSFRGGGYESEWAGNFKLGEKGYHDGFTLARNEALRFIRKYIRDHDITGDIKLWIAGYSRAAATTNLVSGEINNIINRGGSLGNNTRLKDINLYAYCFATPRGTLNNLGYQNIHNTIHPGDAVPKVAPIEFGFMRFGQFEFIPTATSSSNYNVKLNKMLNMYEKLDGVTRITPKEAKEMSEEITEKLYLIEDFQMKKVLDVDWNWFETEFEFFADDTENNTDQADFLDNFINRISENVFKSRSNYVDKFQVGIRTAFSLNSENSDFFKVFLTKIDFGELFKEYGKLMFGKPEKKIEKYINETLEELDIDSYKSEEIKKMAENIGDALIPILKEGLSMPNYTTTLICNFDVIGSNHYPELYLAWMQSVDSNYTTNVSRDFVIGSTRIIRINCPIDVEVYDSDNNLVASIIDDIPQEIAESSIVSSINEDGEKLVYLPADEDYSAKLIATDSGEMSASINEYSYHTGSNLRILNYYDINVEEDDVFTVAVPAFDVDDVSDAIVNGSKVKYLLADTDGNTIASDVSIMGEEAQNARFDINVYVEEDYGFVLGSGRRSLGDYARITAIPTDGYEFEGWYVNDEKISSEAEYRFRIEEDLDIFARFAPNDFFTQNVYVEVKTDKSKYAIGDTVKIEETISNMDSDEAIEDFKLMTVIFDELGIRRWESNKSDLSLLQADSIVVNDKWSTENAKLGEYKVVTAAYREEDESRVFVSNETSFEIVESTPPPQGGGRIVTPQPQETAQPQKNVEESETVEEIPATIPKDISVFVSTDKRAYTENEVITYKIKYYNLMDSPTGKFELFAKVPSYTEVIEADGGIVEGDAIKWQISALNKKESGEITYKVKVNEIPKSEIKIKNTFEIKDDKLINPKNTISNIEVMVRTGRHGDITHKSYINGYPDQSFKPDKNITRGEAAAILSKIMELPIQSDIEKAEYKDVDSSHWAAGHIEAVTSANIFTGYEDGTFRPDNTISRAELCVVVFKYLNLDEKDAIKESFTDTKGHWALNFIEEISRNKIIRGYEDGSFKPNGKVTRAEAIVMINKMLYRGSLKVDENTFIDLEKDHWAFEHVEDAARNHKFTVDKQGNKVLVE